MEAIIIILQLCVFAYVGWNIYAYWSIFRSKASCDVSEFRAPKIVVETRNKTQRTIRDNINNYLEKNANGSADYQLMQDIVERNVESQEETIHQWTPIPLYMGLMGTMACIITGVRHLDIVTLGDTNSGALISIQNLLSAVGSAMTVSIIGIILTTIITIAHRMVAEHVERGKNDFLSTLQTQLLPNMAGNIAGIMSRMADRLSKFNKDFKANADKFSSTMESMNSKTLAHIQETAEAQLQLIDQLSRIDVSMVATANMGVLHELRKNVKQITDGSHEISHQLATSGEYLKEVRQLNDRLDKTEERTKNIETMALFFQKWGDKMHQMRADSNAVFAGVDSALSKGAEDLKDSVTRTTQSMSNALTEMTSQFGRQTEQLGSQLHRVLQERSSELDKLKGELHSVENEMKVTSDKTAKALSQIRDELMAMHDTIENQHNPKPTTSRRRMSGATVAIIILLVLVVLLLGGMGFMEYFYQK